MSWYYDDPVEQRPKKSPAKKFLFVALGIFSISFGSTYAANISIGTGGGVEFGQGIQVASACDASVFVNPIAAFVNSSSASNTSFGVETVTVTDIGAGCIGKSFRLKLFDSTTSVALNTTPVIVSYSATPTNGQTYNGSTWSSGAASLAVTGAKLASATIDTTGTGSDSRVGRTSLTLNGIFASASTKVQSASVGRVTLESVAYIPIYSVGEAGPAGGTIFITPTSLGNSTGDYFEFGPVDIEASMQWATGFSGAPVRTSAENLAIGGGKANTAVVAPLSSGGAIRAADAYVVNGYSDWFLGSRDEMNALCMYARGILATKNPAVDTCNTGTLSGSWASSYMSSSGRYWDGYAWRVVMTGYGWDFTTAAGAVRPIRQFSPAS
jgi:hypothetical protein